MCNMVAKTIHLCGGVMAIHEHSYIHTQICTHREQTKSTAIETGYLISGKSYKKKKKSKADAGKLVWTVLRASSFKNMVLRKRWGYYTE